MLLWAGLTFAHIPHDEVDAIAAPAGGPWFAALSPHGPALLLRSDNQGKNWYYTGGPPVVDTLTDGVAVGGASVFLGEGRYWWWDGEWQEAPLPAEVTALSAQGDTLWAGGPQGLWATTLGGTWEQLFPYPVAAVGGAALVDSVGAVWVWNGESFVARGGEFRTAIAADGEVYAGDTLGNVWRWDDGWWMCHVLPEVEEPTITHLGWGDQALFVLTGSEGPFMSTDACATWVDRRAPFHVLYGVSGGAESIETAFIPPVFSDDTLLVGGWAGLAVSDDLGQTWTTPTLLPPDYSRGLAFSPGFNGDGVVLMGTYGGGVVVTHDGGASFSAPNIGLPEPNVQGLDVWTGNNRIRIYGIVAHQLYRSEDGGVIWEPIETPFDADEQLFLQPEEESLVVVGSGGVSPMALTVDDGESWTFYDPLAALLPGAALRGIARVTTDSGPVTCVMASAQYLACSSDQLTWTLRYTSDSTMLPPIAWPHAAPTRLVIANEDTVRYSDDGGLSWAFTILDEPPSTLIHAGAETLFLFSRGGHVLRSDDGAESWKKLGVFIPAAVFVAEARPDFEATDFPADDVLIATADGMYRLAEASGDAPVLVPWGRFQRSEAGGTDYIHCPLCPEGSEWDGAAFGTIQAVPMGAALDTALRGDLVRIVGVVPTVTRIAVQIDGVERLRTDLMPTALGSLVELGGLTDGWHSIVVKVEAGGPLLIDGMEAESPSEPLYFRPCGCTDGRASLAALLPWSMLWGPLLWWRRRLNKPIA